MDSTIIITLISVILSISLASERLVTFLKSVFPYLAGPQAPDIPDPNSNEEKVRKITLMIISFLTAWIAASFLNGKFDLFDGLDTKIENIKIPFLIIGLMASGGSAFWNSLLSYVKASRDVTQQQNFQESVRSKQLNLAGITRQTKTISFIAKFSGGAGTLKIQFDNAPDIDFSGDGQQNIDLPLGSNNYVVSGAASPGTGGAVVLDIKGPALSTAPHHFGAGPVLPNLFTLFVS